VLVDLDLVDHVAPIQLAIRLLIPSGSKLCELSELREHLGEFDESALSYHWSHTDPSLDELCSRIRMHIKRAEAKEHTRQDIFSGIWKMAHAGHELQDDFVSRLTPVPSRVSIPYLNEPWYC
jgi:hypothetical protein